MISAPSSARCVAEGLGSCVPGRATDTTMTAIRGMTQGERHGTGRVITNEGEDPISIVRDANGITHVQASGEAEL